MNASKKLMKRAALFFSGVLFLLAESCSADKNNTADISIVKADNSVVTVKAEIAQTAAERERGFMNRKHIPAGTGMIFIFETDQVLSFWMKNTPVALSIAFIDSSGVIRDIFDMTPFSLAEVQSTVSVRYVLEVPKGWFSENGIKTGDTVIIPPRKNG